MRLFGSLGLGVASAAATGRLLVRERYGRGCDGLATIASGAQFAKEHGVGLAISADFNMEMNRIDVERLDAHVGSTVSWDCSELYSLRVVQCLRPVLTEFSIDELRHEMATEALWALYEGSERMTGEPVRLSSELTRRARFWIEQVRNDRTSSLMVMVNRISLNGTCLARVEQTTKTDGLEVCTLPRTTPPNESTVCDYRFDRTQTDHIFRTSRSIRQAFVKLQADYGEAVMILSSDGQDPTGDEALRSLVAVDPRWSVRQVVSVHRPTGYETFWMELAVMVYADVLFANHLGSCSGFVGQWRGVAGGRTMFPTWCFGG